MLENSAKIYSVSELTKNIRSLLEFKYPSITVEGEISNFKPSSTGHFYFSLKDNDAVLSAVMFRGRTAKLTFKPEDGQLVSVRGGISVYPKRGSYQIICESMEVAGRGAILAMLEERKRKLQEEGFFDESRKKKLPLFPKRIAVITSPTGAALRDILRVLKRRNSCLNLTILPAPVQGSEAAGIIARQIRCANEFNLGEVIIITRGGGSLEDLLPFSEEIVVRSIAASEIPIISAVGHEIDYALSDFAADKRVPTPSAAAETVSEQREALIRQISDCTRTLHDEINNRIHNIRTVQAAFTAENLERNFRMCVQPLNLRFDDTKERIIRCIGDLIRDFNHRYSLVRNGLLAYSPYSILERGYAIVSKDTDGSLVTRKDQVSPEEKLKVTVYQGNFPVRVSADESSNGDNVNGKF
ncbi:MAG: exodeoxyribonuclease VII large subunit [Spirochaetia bacterium]